MTNAEQIQRITETAKALRTKLETLYSELPDNPLLDAEQTDIIKRGLKLKKEADIFTDEERAFFYEIDRADSEARQLLSDLIEEKKQIERAEKRDAFYESPMRIFSLSDILDENATDMETATAIITDIQELRALSTGIGWGRYEALLHKNYKRITAEIRAIVKELKAVKFVETEHMKLEFPNAIHIQFETDYYRAESLLLLPEKPTHEETAEMLAPLLYHHRKALEESEYSTSLIDTLIRSKSKELAKAADVSIQGDAFSEIFTTSVDTYTFTKDKVSNQLTKLVAGKERKLALESQKDRKKGKGTEITTLVTLNFDELSEGEDGIKKLKSLDNMDRVLIDALFSVWLSAESNGELINGIAVTTLQVLYRIITKNPNSRLDAAKEQDLIDRLHKLNSAGIKINAKAESKYYEGLTNFERSGQLASTVIDRAIINGNTVDNAVYINPIYKNPLYTYAKIKNQIASVPLKQLDTKGRYKTEETIAIESALIRRIEAIGRLSNEILIDNLLEEAGITKESYKNFKKKRSETIKKIEDILKGYVVNGYIKKYSITPRGRLQYYKIIIHK